MIVAWGGVEYPALVDPAWSATGSMASARHGHTATRLGSNKVLVARGITGNNTTQASALRFDSQAGGSVRGGKRVRLGILRRWCLLLSRQAPGKRGDEH